MLIDNQRIINILEKIPDPEIPVLSVMDLGIVRNISQSENEILITITPTYSGCPAMDMIKDDIIDNFHRKGIKVTVQYTLSPPWTTDWLSEKGKRKLKEYGIAPPVNPTANKKALLNLEKTISCTHCGSINTEIVSQFGSTPCKALFKCNDCLEPFDYFKCL